MHDEHCDLLAKKHMHCQGHYVTLRVQTLGSTIVVLRLFTLSFSLVSEAVLRACDDPMYRACGKCKTQGKYIFGFGFVFHFESCFSVSVFCSVAGTSAVSWKILNFLSMKNDLEGGD